MYWALQPKSSRPAFSGCVPWTPSPAPIVDWLAIQGISEDGYVSISCPNPCLYMHQCMQYGCVWYGALGPAPSSCNRPCLIHLAQNPARLGTCKSPSLSSTRGNAPRVRFPRARLAPSSRGRFGGGSGGSRGNQESFAHAPPRRFLSRLRLRSPDWDPLGCSAAASPAELHGAVVFLLRLLRLAVVQLVLVLADPIPDLRLLHTGSSSSPSCTTSTHRQLRGEIGPYPPLLWF
jgi:hypothetical protein